MLSVEIPPQDPSCSSPFQPLNSNTDERACTKGPNHRPNFSIRDYVFTVRSREIKKSWPFSSKNLQLCLNNGVKELLPPFDTVSRQSIKRCQVESSPLQKEKTGDCAVRDSNSDDLQLNYKLVESCLDISSCRSVDAGEFGSTTTTTASHSETKPLSKKCRLIVKLGGNSDRISTEDIASASTASKIMASNVCPVCKTFSSSSNTTLNAHIDQCLSVESTPRWTSDSKLKRQRIKPRKTRLMVDIYSTALPCTLEELDRRNGTTWAAGSCLPMQEIERTGNEGKRLRVTQSHPEDIGDVGPVYVDSNGRKVRILSKSDDLPSLSKVAGDIEARKPHKGDKGGKNISKKKKKRLAQNHHGFLKLAPQSKMNFSLNNEGSQIVEEECEGEAKSFEEENGVSNQTKQSDSITLKPWICSKRRGFTKKTCQEGRQSVRSKWHLTQDLPAFYDRSFFGGTDLSEISTSAAKHDKIQKVRVSKKREESPGRKRMGNSTFPAVRPTSVQVGNHGKRAQSYPSRKNKVNRNGRSSVIKSVLSKVQKLSALKMKKRNVKESSRKGEEYDLMHNNAENHDGRREIAYESHEMNTLHVSEQLEELAIRTSEPDHAFQPNEDYERLLFGTESEAPLAPNELHYSYDLDMFSADETENRQYFPEVDPIPIPGPPGSFLPSPRDMGSEDFPGNSSLTTSRVHSSLDHHDVVDGDSSGSPMSASSTISNSAADRCNFKIESSLRRVDTVPPANCEGVEKNGFDRIYVDKGPLGLEIDQKPCCCQRKERFLNLQESELLRRRTVATNAFPAGGNYNSNPISAHLDTSSELAPKMVLSAGTISFRDSAGSVSASTPVIRLMGKNLLVLNKDDGPSLNTQISPQVPAFPEASLRDHDSHSLTYRGSYQCYEEHSGTRLSVNAQLPTGTDYSFLARKPVKEISIIDGVPESGNTAINNAVKGNTSWGCTSGSTALHFSQGLS